MTHVDFGTTSWVRQEDMLSELSAGWIQTQPLTQYRLPGLQQASPSSPITHFPFLIKPGDCSVRVEMRKMGGGVCLCVWWWWWRRGCTSCVKPHPEQASLHLTVNKYSLLRAASVNCHRLGSQSPSSPNRKVQGGEGDGRYEL